MKEGGRDEFSTLAGALTGEREKFWPLRPKRVECMCFYVDLLGLELSLAKREKLRELTCLGEAY